MKPGFRQSMNWLHTYSGLLVGWVLFTVFAAGTASYFRDQITVWMKPELHALARTHPAQPEMAQRAVDMLQQHAPASQRWFITLPGADEPGLRASWIRSAKETAPPAPGVERRARLDSAILDPASGMPFAAARSTRGGEFLYRLHFDLHYMPAIWARWIIGFCAMFMLVAILSGVVTHRRIFADFFTFRPRKGQRSWLDAHNAVAVVGLPYHLMITYTGLVTLMFMYLPQGPKAAYGGDQEAFFAEVFPAIGPRNPQPSGIAAPLVPLAPLVAQASARWNGAPIGRITVNNPNDASATITVARQEGHDMNSSQPALVFDGTTGRLLSVAGESTGPALQARGVLYGLHLARFADPLLRALFFLCGLAGTAMVATGLLLWAVKERQKAGRAKAGWASRLVDGLNVGTIAGLPLAMAVLFWANRLLPVGMAQRAQAEIDLFFTAWAVAAVLGLARPTLRMWQLQLGVGGLLFAAIPLLNALTTTTHLGHSLPAGWWAVAGFDLVCLALSLAMERHHADAFGTLAVPGRRAIGLRTLGSVELAVSLLACIAQQGPT
ncbi:MAG TPA: DUF3325 family protein, partial [Ramlibacter sp.]